MGSTQLEQSTSLIISLANSNLQETSVNTPVLGPNVGWVQPGTNPSQQGMGWTLGVTSSLGVGSLKYSIKSEQGADVLIVNSVPDGQTGRSSLILKSPEGIEVLQLLPSPETQSTNLVLPTGESLGKLVVETKIKKDKHKDGEKQKDKKDKKDKSKDGEKHKDKKDKKDKDHKAPKRQYLIRNPSEQESMKVSLKSKPKDQKLEMKIKSLVRKGEICTVESVSGSSSFRILFKSTEVGAIPNEKLYATGAVIGIVELERSLNLNFQGTSQRFKFLHLDIQNNVLLIRTTFRKI